MTEVEESKKKPMTTLLEDGNADYPSLKYPVGAFFILAGYLLDRFVYYGLFGGVVFYMQRALRFSASTSSTLKAAIEGLIYLAPIPGAVLADTYLGKFRTIFTMCCIYTIGSFVFTLSSISPIMASVEAIQATGMGGVFILGISAGLMKAVYTSLGPDQFKVPEQRRQQQRFFYAFYWVVNAGAFFGQILTAQLRSSVQCFGNDCYMLPFVIFCGLAILSTIVFFSGKKWYQEAPPDTMLLNSLKCIFYATKKSITERDKPVDHWIDRAGDKYDAKLIEDVKKTLRVLLLFVTFPFFWTLFYHTFTSMIFQAKRLYDRIGLYRIPPEVTSSISPLLILILIPLFELLIYPFLDRRRILKTSTSRMLLGMVLASISFIVYGAVNIAVEQNVLGTKQAQLNVYNPRECTASLSSDWLPENIEIPAGHEFKLEPVDLSDEEVIYSILCNCGSHSQKLDIKLIEKHETTIVLFSNKIRVLNPTKDYLKDKDAEAKVRLITDTSPSTNDIWNQYTLVYGDLIEILSSDRDASDFGAISPQNYTLNKDNKTVGIADIRQDGVYDIVVTEGRGIVFNMTKPSTTHMGWLFPQYLIITTGELLFSVSSMDFAYSEAPPSMKSVLQAVRLLTIAVGFWMFAIITKTTTATGVFEYRASTEAFAYAVGMSINTVVFFFLVRYYNRQKRILAEKESQCW